MSHHQTSIGALSSIIYSKELFNKYIDKIGNNKVQFKKRSRMKIEVANKTYYCLNDLYLHSCGQAYRGKVKCVYKNRLITRK